MSLKLAYAENGDYTLSEAGERYYYRLGGLSTQLKALYDAKEDGIIDPIYTCVIVNLRDKASDKGTVKLIEIDINNFEKTDHFYVELVIRLIKKQCNIHK